MPLTPGVRLGGRYEIVAAIGAGGMGEVYRARDTRLLRSVAVKILPERLARDAEALERLEREAKALAALQHPNILTVHDFGNDQGVFYVVMELLEGETLRERLTRERLDWKDAVSLGAAIADGLAAAHSRGVVHRDVKPENVFLTSAGSVKVLDFGVARREASSTSAEAQSLLTTMSETAPGTLLGTLAYISPEQLQGVAADARSDLFALGCILYEMLYGSRPFARETVAETIAALLRDEPPETAADGVPPLLAALVLRCLAKDPEQRPRTADELAAELRICAEASTLAAAAATARRRGSRAGSLLAVLPFANSDPETEYLSDGMTEDLIGAFSRVANLRVMARSTVFRYKGRAVEPLEAGRRLGVKSVLTGRVSRRGEKLSVAVELVNVADGTQRWGDQFTTALDELCSVQGKIVAAVSDMLLKKRGARSPRRGHQRLAGTEAYQLTLKARYHWYRRPQGTLKAIELFEHALELDPEHAPAWAGLADCYMSLGGSGVGTLPPSAVMPKAKAAVTRALELDPELAEAHASLGHITMHFDWDFAKAEESLKEALRRNPRSASAHHWLSHLHTILGRTDDSLAEATEALALDPLDLSMNVHLAWHHYFAKEYDRAIQEANRTLALDPSSFWPHHLVGTSYDMKRQFPAAIEALERATALAPDLPVGLSALGHAYARAGRTDDAERVLAQVEDRGRTSYVPPHVPAMIEVALGREDAALASLERAYVERSDFLPYLAAEPVFAPIADLPQFCDLLERVGLER